MRIFLRKMRISNALAALFPAIRQRLLVAVLLHPDRGWYLSELARSLAVQPSSLQRELRSLVQAGILRLRKDGNRAYYQADPTCPFLPELQGLLVKTAGIADVIRRAIAPVAPRIRCAFIFGSMARGEEVGTSDVDLFIIGDLGLQDVAPFLRKMEADIGRPVNPTLYTSAEFARKLQSGHHFLGGVLRSPKIFLLGNEADLVTTSGGTSRAEARDG